MKNHDKNLQPSSIKNGKYAALLPLANFHFNYVKIAIFAHFYQIMTQNNFITKFDHSFWVKLAVFSETRHRICLIVCI